MTEGTTRLVLRRRVANPFQGGLILVFDLVPLSGTLAMFGDHSVGAAIALGAVTALLTYIGVRFFVIRVTLDAKGISMVNIFRNYRLPWSVVESVAPATAGATARPIGNRTTAGRVIRCSGITPGRGEPLRTSDKWVAAINRYLVASGHS